MGFLALTQRLAKREAGPEHLPFPMLTSQYFPRPPACLTEAPGAEQSRGLERHWEGRSQPCSAPIAQSPAVAPAPPLFCLEKAEVRWSEVSRISRVMIRRLQIPSYPIKPLTSDGCLCSEFPGT